MKKLLLAVLALLSFSMAAEAATVCHIGDSITAGGKRLRTQLYNAHPDWQYVGNYYDDKWFHNGIAGDTSAGVVNRLDTIPPCDIALVLIGTNDWMAYLTVQQTVNKIQNIATTLNSRGTTVYVFRLLPRTDCFTCNQRNVNVNQALGESLTNATLLNTWQALNASEYPLSYLLVDGLHPTALGYDEIANYINPLIP